MIIYFNNFDLLILLNTTSINTQTKER